MGTWEPLFGNLGTFTWEPGNFYLGTWNLYLGTFTWEPGNLYLGTFTWEPVLGTCTWNLGTLGNEFWSCSGLLRTFTMAEDPKAFCCWGTKDKRKKICRTDGEARQARFVDAPLLAGNAQSSQSNNIIHTHHPAGHLRLEEPRTNPLSLFWLLVTPLFQGPHGHDFCVAQCAVGCAMRLRTQKKQAAHEQFLKPPWWFGSPG